MDDFDDLPDDLEDIEVIYSDGEDNEEDDHDEDVDLASHDEFEAEVMDLSKLTFEKHGKSVFSGAVSKSGTWAVTGGEDDMAYVWDLTSGEILFECTGHKDSVSHVGINHNDQYIATGDMGGMIQVWSFKEKKLIWCFEGDDMEWLVWHPFTNVLLCGSQSGDIYVWQIPSGNCKVLASPSNLPCTCAKVLPDGKQLVAGYSDGHVRLWDIKGASTLWTNNDSDSVTSLAINSDGSLVVTCPNAHTLKTTDGKKVATLLVSGETEIETALFMDDLNAAVTGSLSGQLCVWQLGKFTLRHQARIECSVTGMERGRDSRVYVGTTDGGVYVCDARAGHLLDVLTGHKLSIFCVVPFGDKVLTTSDDGTAKVFQEV